MLKSSVLTSSILYWNRSMVKEIVITVIFLSVGEFHHSLAQDTIVNTKLGKIRGIEIPYNGQQIYAYLGVPFAKPPLGELRFQRPEPITSWDDDVVMNATSLPPACHQKSPYPFPWYDNVTRQDEDCLYLNIWVPSSLNRDRAVFFWIFSGGFTFGSNSMSVYDGQALAGAGDIIVVTVNYRVGAFGFLYSGTEDAPGNMGLYDILLGLQWVNENIEAFGGNKNKITIGGHSAGSTASEILGVSRLAEGLYQRAILQSGSVASSSHFGDGDENLDLGQKLAEKVGCTEGTLRTTPSTVVSCLRGVNASELAQALSDLKPQDTLTFNLVESDEIIGDKPIEKVNSSDFYATDILTGFVEDETVFEITAKNVDHFGFYGNNSDYMNRTFAEVLLRTELFKKSDDKDKDKLVEYYLGGVDDDDVDEIRTQTMTAYKDFQEVCPTTYYAEEVAKKNKNVFFYLFTKRPSNTPWAPWMGVVHFDEVELVFGQPTVNKTRYTKDEYYLSVELLQMWTNFINYGRPSNEWTAFDSNNHLTRVLGKPYKNIYEEVLDLENCQFLRPYIMES